MVAIQLKTLRHLMLSVLKTIVEDFWKTLSVPGGEAVLYFLFQIIKTESCKDSSEFWKRKNLDETKWRRECGW